ncbi:MAG: EamA family transporter [Pseudomonadota bacterium]
MIDTAQARAALLVLAASLSINVGAAVGKDLFGAVGAEGVAALRCGIAALVLWALVRPWRGAALPRAKLGWLAAYGTTLGAMNLCIYLAFVYLPIGLAVAIEITGPLLLVLLLSRNLRDFVWLALAAGGLALLLPWRVDYEQIDLRGVLFASLAGLCWALYIMLGKRVAGVGASRAVAIGMAFACVVTVPLGILRAGSELLAAPVLLTGLGVALLSSTVPYVLEMKALSSLSGKVFGLVTASAPALAALAAFMVLGERLTGQQWLAVALVMAASAGCALTIRPTAPPLPDA